MQARRENRRCISPVIRTTLIGTAYYQKGLELREALAQETPMVESRRDLMLGYINLGNIRKAQGNLSEAEAYYKKTLELSEELAQETKTVEFCQDLAAVYNRFGVFAKCREIIRKQKYITRKRFELDEELAQKTKMEEYTKVISSNS